MVMGIIRTIGTTVIPMMIILEAPEVAAAAEAAEEFTGGSR